MKQYFALHYLESAWQTQGKETPSRRNHRGGAIQNAGRLRLQQRGTQCYLQRTTLIRCWWPDQVNFKTSLCFISLWKDSNDAHRRFNKWIYMLLKTASRKKWNAFAWRWGILGQGLLLRVCEMHSVVNVCVYYIFTIHEAVLRTLCCKTVLPLP